MGIRVRDSSAGESDGYSAASGGPRGIQGGGTHLPAGVGQADRQRDGHRRVRRLLLEKQTGFPSLQVTARHFHVTPRTLHRRLQEEGTSFRDLLEEVTTDCRDRAPESGRFTSLRSPTPRLLRHGKLPARIQALEIIPRPTVPPSGTCRLQADSCRRSRTTAPGRLRPDCRIAIHSPWLEYLRPAVVGQEQTVEWTEENGRRHRHSSRATALFSVAGDRRSLLGGALAGLWLIADNFVVLGNTSKARAIRIAAIGIALAFILFAIFGPELRSNSMFGALSAAFVRLYATGSYGEAYQAHIGAGGRSDRNGNGWLLGWQAWARQWLLAWRWFSA